MKRETMGKGPVLSKNKHIRSKTKRSIIGWATGLLWMATLLFQALSGNSHVVLTVANFVACIVFFWNLNERQMESRRHFDEREEELKRQGLMR